MSENISNISKRIINYMQINKVSEDEAKETLQKEEQRNDENNAPRIVTYDASDELMAQSDYEAMLAKLAEQQKITEVPIEGTGIVLKIVKSQSGSKCTYDYNADTNTLNINAKKCVIEISKAGGAENLNNVNVVLSGMNVKLNSNVPVASITSSAINCIINGSNENDNITATGLNTTVNARGGNDTINSYGANALIRGGNGNDSITSTGMGTNIFAGAGDDNIFASGLGVYVDSGTGEGEVNVHGNNIAVDTGISGNKTVTGDGSKISVASGNAANDITLLGADNDVNYDNSNTSINPNDNISVTDTHNSTKNIMNVADRDYDSVTGLNADGYDENGYKDGLNFNGYDESGYDKYGYNIYGVNNQGKPQTGGFTKGSDGKIYLNGELYFGLYTDTTVDNTERLYKNGVVDREKQVYAGKLYDNGEIDTKRQVFNHELYDGGVKQTTNRDSVLNLAEIALNNISQETYIGTKLVGFTANGNTYSVTYDNAINNILTIVETATGKVTTTYVANGTTKAGTVENETVTGQTSGNQIKLTATNISDSNKDWSVDIANTTVLDNFLSVTNQTLSGVTLNFKQVDGKTPTITVGEGDSVVVEDGKIKITNGGNVKFYNLDGTEYINPDEPEEDVYSVTQNGMVYKNGQAYSGNYEGVNYQAGKLLIEGSLANGTINGVTYENGIATNIKDIAVTEQDGKLYKDNKLYTGMYNNFMYSGGTKLTGVSTLDNRYYANGVFDSTYNGSYKTNYYVLNSWANNISEYEIVNGCAVSLTTSSKSTNNTLLSTTTTRYDSNGNITSIVSQADFVRDENDKIIEYDEISKDGAMHVSNIEYDEETGEIKSCTRTSLVASDLSSCNFTENNLIQKIMFNGKEMILYAESLLTRSSLDLTATIDDDTIKINNNSSINIVKLTVFYPEKFNFDITNNGVMEFVYPNYDNKEEWFVSGSLYSHISTLIGSGDYIIPEPAVNSTPLAKKDNVGKLYVNGIIATGVINNKLYIEGSISTQKQDYQGKLYDDNGDLDTERQVFNHELYDGGVKQTTNRDSVLSLAEINLNAISGEVYTGNKLSGFNANGKTYTVSYDTTEDKTDNVLTIVETDTDNVTTTYITNGTTKAGYTTRPVGDTFKSITAKNPSGNDIYSITLTGVEGVSEITNASLAGATINFTAEGSTPLRVTAGNVTFENNLIKVTNGSDVKLYNLDGTEYDSDAPTDNRAVLLTMLELGEDTSIDNDPTVEGGKLTAFSITKNGETTHYNVTYDDATNAIVIKITDKDNQKSTKAFNADGTKADNVEIRGRMYVAGEPATATIGDKKYVSGYVEYQKGYIDKIVNLYDGIDLEDIDNWKMSQANTFTCNVGDTEYEYGDKSSDGYYIDVIYEKDHKYTMRNYNTRDVLYEMEEYDDTESPELTHTIFDDSTGNREYENTFTSYGLQLSNTVYGSDGNTVSSNKNGNADVKTVLDELASYGYDASKLTAGSWGELAEGMIDFNLTSYVRSDIGIYIAACQEATTARNAASAAGQTQAQAQQAYENAFNEHVANALVPIKTSTEDSSIEAGDIFEVNDELYVKDGDNVVKLKMSKDQYLELFPVIDRYASQQGDIGDCYLISGVLIGALENKTAFAKLIQMFEYNGNDLTITFEGMKELDGDGNPKYSVTFEGGQLYEMDGVVTSQTNAYYYQGVENAIIGAKGIQLLEQAYAIACFRRESVAQIDTIDVDDALNYIQSGWNHIAQNNVFGASNGRYLYFCNATEDDFTDVDKDDLLAYLNAEGAIQNVEGNLLQIVYSDEVLLEAVRDITDYYYKNNNGNIWNAFRTSTDEFDINGYKSYVNTPDAQDYNYVRYLSGITDTTIKLVADFLKDKDDYPQLIRGYEVADENIASSVYYIDSSIRHAMFDPYNRSDYIENLETMSIYEALNSDQQAMFDYIMNYVEDGNIILGTSTSNYGDITYEGDDGAQYYLLNGHAYAIESVNKEDQTINVINPWTGAMSVTMTLEQFKNMLEGVYIKNLSETTNDGGGSDIGDADAEKLASKNALFSTWTLGNSYKDTATDFTYDDDNNLTSFKVNNKTYEVLYDGKSQMAVVTQENESTSGVYNLTENNIISELEKNENVVLLNNNVNIYPDNFGSYINYDNYQEYTVETGKLINKGNAIDNKATDAERTQCLNILEKLNTGSYGLGFDNSQLIISNVQYTGSKITGFDITNTDNTFVDDLVEGNKIVPSGDAGIIKTAQISDIQYSGEDITQITADLEDFSNTGVTSDLRVKLYYSQGKLVKEEYVSDYGMIMEYEYQADKVVKETMTTVISGYEYARELAITYYEGTDNRKTETSTTTYDYEDEDKTIRYETTNMTTYTYDSQNRVVTKTQTQTINISGTNIPTEYTSFSGQPSTTTTTYSYDTATGLVSKITSESASNDYDNYETNYEYYTESGLAGLLKKETTTYSKSAYMNEEVLYEYANDGKLLKEQHTCSNDKTRNTETQYIYNSNGDLARSIELGYNAIMARDLAKYRYNIDNNIDVENSQAKINEILSGGLIYENYAAYITNINDIVSLPDNYKTYYLQNEDKVKGYQEEANRAINDFLTLYNKFINDNKNNIYTGNSNAMNKQQVAHILSKFFGTENEKVWYGDNLIKIMKNPDLPSDLRQAAANLLNLNEQYGSIKEFVEVSNKINDNVTLIYFQTTEELKLQDVNTRIQELENKSSLTTEEKQLLTQYKQAAQKHKNNIEALRYGDFLQYMYNEGLLEKPDTSLPTNWEVSPLTREATYLNMVNKGTITANTTSITAQDKTLISASFIKDTSVAQTISVPLTTSAVEALFQSDTVSNGTLNDSFFLSVYREMTPEQRENLISVDMTNGTVTVNLLGALNYQVATSRTYNISDLEQITQVAMTYEVNGENKTVIRNLCPDNILARAVEMAIIDNHGADIFDTDYYYGDVFTYLTTTSTVEKRGDYAEWERAIAFIKDDVTYTIKDMDSDGNISYYNPDSPEEIMNANISELSEESVRVIQTIDRHGRYDLSNLDWDPIVFDIDNNEEITTDIIDYDIDGDGIADKINDVTDFVLAFDKNKNGVYGEDGTELFGTATDLNNDGIVDGYANGFEALKALAEKYHLINDKDRVLDSNDIAFLENVVGLRMKQGYLGDAYKFSDIGITAIYIPDTDEVRYQEDFDGNGNDMMTQNGATFIVNDEVRTYVDIWHKKQ